MKMIAVMKYHRSIRCISNDDDDRCLLHLQTVDDDDDNDDNGEDDYEDDHSDHSHHHKYHCNILCISSSAWITIIVASVALQVVSTSLLISI